MIGKGNNPNESNLVLHLLHLLAVEHVNILVATQVVTLYFVVVLLFVALLQKDKVTIY